MSAVAASSAINYSKLMPAADWNSYKEVCKHNSEMQSWETDLKTYADEIMKTLKGGGGLSIDSLKPFTTYALHSNKKTLNEILQVKKDIVEGKGSSKKMKNYKKKLVDVLGDEYIKISSHTLDFLSEMENFLMLARNSHSYAGNVIQQYFEMDTNKRGNAHNKKISEKLKRLRSSEDSIYEHSAESLLQKAVSLKTQHEAMLLKLKDEIARLEEKEKSARSWKKIIYTIYVSSVVGLVIAGIVTAAILAPPLAGAIAGVVPLATVGHWTVSVLQESEKQYKNLREAKMKMQKETRVSIKELGDIKYSIDAVIGSIDSILYTPKIEMDQEQIDFTMKQIERKLTTFLNKIEDLEKDVENCKKEIRKARNDVHII